jgi:HEPN domain-containing protein
MKQDMHRAEAKAWLENEERACRQGRLDRLNWVAGLMPISNHLTFPGGWIAKHLFEEARYSFVYGQFLAAIVMGMAYVEHTLAALLYGAGRSDLERASVSALLQEAVKDGWLSEEESNNLDHARTLRNAVTHFRRPLHEDTVEYRSVALSQLPYSILEEDARHVMVIAFRVHARQTA